jgi:ATP-dependent RNA helicase RhlE
LRHLLLDQNIEYALVFTRTRDGADRVTRDLNRNNIQAQAIHGDKSQQARQRALQQFKDRRKKNIQACLERTK